MMITADLLRIKTHHKKVINIGLTITEKEAEPRGQIKTNIEAFVDAEYAEPEATDSIGI